jgi:hypothetical protein
VRCELITPGGVGGRRKSTDCTKGPRCLLSADTKCEGEWDGTDSAGRLSKGIHRPLVAFWNLGISEDIWDWGANDENLEIEVRTAPSR